MTNLGQVGVWLGGISLWSAADERAAVRAIESMGYGAVWIGESHANREIFAHAATLLGCTERIVVATGVAGIWSRDPSASANGTAALAEAFPGRFVLTLGVSHAPIVTRRGHDYTRPYSAMVEHLDGMAAARYAPPAPAEPAPLLLGALHPRMLRLAAEQTDGAHPYLVTPEHTAWARGILGPAQILAPEQGVVLSGDAAAARAAARAHLAIYAPLPNYTRCWRMLGFGDGDIDDGCSDRLVDELVAWGDEDAIAERVRAHLTAGATHVPVQALGDDPLGQLERLAPVLNSL